MSYVRIWCLRSDFYPRPPGGGRQVEQSLFTDGSFISIHALRVEGDYLRERGEKVQKISIHALRVEGDFS